MRRAAPLIWILLLLTLAACGGRQAAAPEKSLPAAAMAPAAAERAAESSPPPPEAPPEPEPDTDAARLAALLDGMSLEEKVGQLFFVRCAEPGMAAKIAQYHVGGVLLFTRDYKDEGGNWLSEAALTAKLQAYRDASAIPPFIGSDEEGGTVTRATRNPNLFPAKLAPPRSLWRAGGMDGLLAETLSYNERLRALGISVNLAPVADVSADPRDFIYERTFGQDAEATADYVARVVETMGEAGIGCVLKHFPGYGSNADTHTGVAVDTRPRETFDTSDLLPFAAGIDAGAPFVLVSHNVVTCLDADYPASLSPAAYALLRGELGFDGVALTDDLAMDAVKAYAENGDAATLALLAGCDMVVTTDFETQIAQVLAAVAEGTLPLPRVDEACLRVLRAKLQLGLLGD